MSSFGYLLYFLHPIALVMAAGLLWYVKFLLTHIASGQSSNQNKSRHQLLPQEVGFTDKHKLEEKNHKRISYTGLTVIAAIVVIAVAIGVHFSLYSLPSFSSFFPFSNAGSEEILPAPATASKQNSDNRCSDSHNRCIIFFR